MCLYVEVICKIQTMYVTNLRSGLEYIVKEQNDSAELRVKERKDLTLDFWRNNVDALLSFQNKDVLKGIGSISNAQMKNFVDGVYEEFNQRRILYAAQETDKQEKDELRDLESEIRGRKIE